MPNIEQPLVSVGIPTYERPEGLRNTLNYLTQQTYKNLEIIISDNCSAGGETRVVAEQFMSCYSNIKYFRQEQNIGVVANFKFVLEKATGEYFMWAADDDEWCSNFIEVCLNNSVSGSSVMTGFVTHYRKSGMRVNNKLPNLSSGAHPSSNVRNFLKCMQPSLFYGLHSRKSILFYLEDDFFYFYDCYFVLKIILNSNFETLPNHSLYAAGIDDETYQIKHLDSAKKSKLEYWPFLRSVILLILASKKLRWMEKSSLINEVLITIARLFLHHKNLLPAKVSIRRRA